MTAPVPLERKRARGNPGCRRLPAPGSVPDLERADGTPPEHLGRRGREVYKLIHGAAPWVGASDRPLLVEVAELYDRREELRALLERDGNVMTTPTGYAYLHPAAGHLLQLDRHLHRLLVALGLTPVERSRLGLAEVKAASKLQSLRTAREGRSAPDASTPRHP